MHTDIRRPPSRTGTPPLPSFTAADNLIINFDDDEDATPLPAQPGVAVTSQRAPSGPLQSAPLAAGKPCCPFRAGVRLEQRRYHAWHISLENFADGQQDSWVLLLDFRLRESTELSSWCFGNTAVHQPHADFQQVLAIVLCSHAAFARRPFGATFLNLYCFLRTLTLSM